MKSKTAEKERVRKPNANVISLRNLGSLGLFLPGGDAHSGELHIMRRSIAALVLTAASVMATVAAPSQSQAQWRVGGYPSYYGYSNPAHVYGYASPSYGYGYANGPAYGLSYYYGGYRPDGYINAGPPAVRRIVIHRARRR